MAAPINVVILAAGQGKRMHSALPKVLHPLAGKPLAMHVIDTARNLEPRAIAIVYGHGGEAVRSSLAADDLVFALQDPPRGTGDAVRVALEKLPPEGVTVIALADVPLVPAEALRAVADSAARGSLALWTARMANPHGLGRIVRDTRGAITGIVEERDATPEQRAIEEINTGIMAAPTAQLARWVARLEPNNTQREFYLTDIIGMAVAEGVPVESTPGREVEALGVNDRAQLAQAERVLQRQRADALLQAGTWIADPARFDQRGTLTCGRDVRIDVGCVFEGDVRLGDGVSIGPYSVLRDVEIGEGTEVLAFCHLESSRIGGHARIGPFARLRPGNELGDEVHIGNFVEVKASTLGRGAKANHLAYVGDSELGADVNFGAGAITANYDGAYKHKTVIGKGAHIGSNCVLVAPITVGDGATIGGGSTIARDAPEGKLTLTRATQVTVEHWTRPVKRKG